MSSEEPMDEVRGLRELVAKEVLKNLSATFGVVAPQPALAEKPYPAWVTVHVIGQGNGVIRVTFIDPNGKWSDGVTLSYRLLEARRMAEGLKVAVAVGLEPERKEGDLFVIEGVINQQQAGQEGGGQA